MFRCESWRLKQRHLSTTDPPRSPQTAPSLPASLPALSPATSPPTVPHQRCQTSAEPQTPCRTGRRRARGPGTGVTLRPASPPNAPAGRQSGSSPGTAVLGRRRQCLFSQGRGASSAAPHSPGEDPGHRHPAEPDSSLPALTCSCQWLGAAEEAPRPEAARTPRAHCPPVRARPRLTEARRRRHAHARVRTPPADAGGVRSAAALFRCPRAWSHSSFSPSPHLISRRPHNSVRAKRPHLIPGRSDS